MAVYHLQVGQTYYDEGFFNVTKQFDQFVRADPGPIELILRSSLGEQRLQARVERGAQANGTARVHGNVPLREWFRGQVRLGGVVDVEFLSTSQMRLTPVKSPEVFRVLEKEPWGGPHDRPELAIAVPADQRRQVLEACESLLTTAATVARLPDAAAAASAAGHTPVPVTALEPSIRVWRDFTDPDLIEFRLKQPVSVLDMLAHIGRVVERLMAAAEADVPPRTKKGDYNSTEKARQRIAQLAAALRTALQAKALVLVEAEETVGNRHDNWKDVTGAEYHFPNQYRNRIRPGVPFVYYRGVRRAEGKRGPAEYFGYGRIRDVRLDPETAALPKKDRQWFASIEDYAPFVTPVPAKLPDGSFYEALEHTNLWGVGAREVTMGVYRAILTAAQVANDEEMDPVAKTSKGALLTLPPLQDVKPILSEVALVLRTRSTREVQSPEKAPTQQRWPRHSRYSKQLGDRAEAIVHAHLQASGSRGLVWRSRDGETPGWDIEYDDAGLMAVEVKGTSADAFTSFEMTAQEWSEAERLRGRYSIYLVSRCASSDPRIAIIPDPFGQRLVVTPSVWLVELPGRPVPRQG